MANHIHRGRKQFHSYLVSFGWFPNSHIFNLCICPIGFAKALYNSIEITKELIQKWCWNPGLHLENFCRSPKWKSLTTFSCTFFIPELITAENASSGNLNVRISGRNSQKWNIICALGVTISMQALQKNLLKSRNKTIPFVRVEKNIFLMVTLLNNLVPGNTK